MNTTLKASILSILEIAFAPKASIAWILGHITEISKQLTANLCDANDMRFMLITAGLVRVNSIFAYGLRLARTVERNRSMGISSVARSLRS